MNTILSDALHEYHVLREQLDRALLGKDSLEWSKELKKFLRKEPCWAEEMIFTPLEWGPNLGSVSCDKDTADAISRSNMSDWRVPTITELCRGLKKPSNGFREEVFYYSSTPSTRGGAWFGNEVMKMSCGQICGSESSFLHESCHLRLCRPIKLPE